MKSSVNSDGLRMVYVLIDDPVHEGKALACHFLDRSEAYHLRCFMTLLLLPADTAGMDPDRPIFSAAFRRVTTTPLIVRSPGVGKLERQMWSFLSRAPLCILMVIGNIPDWAKALGQSRPIGLLTPHDEIMHAAVNQGCFQVGLLKGFSDIAASYKVIEELIGLGAKNERIGEKERLALSTLTKDSLFGNRSRLSFLRPIPLPQPHEGRSAAYLLNRLSNNVDKPSLMPPDEESPSDSFLVLPRLLDYSYATCVAFSGLEMGYPFSKDSRISKSELEAHYTYMLSDATDDLKLERWMRVGEQLTGSEALKSRMVVSAPGARTDLLKRSLPQTLIPDSGYKKFKHIRLGAIADFVAGRTRNKFRNNEEKKEYRNARETLVAAHRLVAVQTALLGVSTHAIPIQIPECGGRLFSYIRDLTTAIRNGSQKVTKLFRRLEIELADSLPEALLAHLIHGDSPVLFYSDLPYEWTLLDNWPICLTRPVSRIPMAVPSCWLSLTQSIFREATIDTRHPERVLVLDLIDERDSIRGFSDMFREVSNGLGQTYTYAKPSNKTELQEILYGISPEVVVLDTHGSYNNMYDELLVYLGDRSISASDFVPDMPLPPVWILSACEVASPGAVKGSMIWQLLRRGAVSVIAATQKIDAFTASMFVGRLLTDIFSPPSQAQYDTLSDAYFVSQVTTALLYDPLLPLLKKARPGTPLSEQLYSVILHYIKYFSDKPIEPKRFRYEAAEILGACIAAHGLTDRQLETVESGQVTPETLLFTAFGAPTEVTLVHESARDV